MSPPTEPELRDSLVALEHYFREKHEHFETFPESASAKQGAAYLDAADRLGAILRPELTYRVVVFAGEIRGLSELVQMDEKSAMDLCAKLNELGAKAHVAAMP